MSHTVSASQTIQTYRTSPLPGCCLYCALLEEVLPSHRTAYAIHVHLEHANGKDDTCTVHDITGDTAFACEIFHKICRGTVTPCTLSEVLSDLLAE